MARKTRLERRIEQLSVELRHEDPSRRYLAACRLHDIAFGSRNPRTPDAAWALVPLLNDPDKEVRYLASEAVARIDTPESLAALKEASRRDGGDWAGYFLKLARNGHMSY